MPRIRKELATAQFAILESNSVMQYLQPDLYISVLDPATADFKDSARLYLDRADALVVVERSLEPRWTGISTKLAQGILRFPVAAPAYLSSSLIDFVRTRMSYRQG